jgi:hypothetical protein
MHKLGATIALQLIAGTDEGIGTAMAAVGKRHEEDEDVHAGP